MIHEPESYRRSEGKPWDSFEAFICQKNMRPIALSDA